MAVVDDVAVGALAAEMRVVDRQVVVAVLDHPRVSCGPESQGEDDAERRDGRQRRQRRHRTQRRNQPPRERIGDEPAGVAQGRLRGEYRRPILGMRALTSADCLRQTSRPATARGNVLPD